MEQHSLHEEPATQAIEDHANTTEQDDITPASTQPTSQHEHSDSMVTIRLSNAGILEANQEVVNAMKELGTGHTELPIPRGPDTDGSVEDRDQDLEVASVPSTEEAATSRAASPTAQDAELIESPIDDAQSLAESVNTNESIDSISIRSSVEIMTAEIARQSSTLGSELDRIIRHRSTSTSSSKSSGSGIVNWAELDKNEEQEERDDATDEVRHTCYIVTWYHTTDTASRPPSCLPDWNKRTMHWLQTPKRESHGIEASLALLPCNN